MKKQKVGACISNGNTLDYQAYHALGSILRPPPPPEKK
jgi:hypothetical protein